MTPALLAELNRLGVIPRPKQKPAQGPIKVVRKGEEPDF